MHEHLEDQNQHAQNSIFGQAGNLAHRSSTATDGGTGVAPARPPGYGRENTSFADVLPGAIHRFGSLAVAPPMEDHSPRGDQGISASLRFRMVSFGLIAFAPPRPTEVLAMSFAHTNEINLITHGAWHVVILLK
ncbi:MAG: hypothetical protein AAGB11_10965 [Pseudomonadota bacterium]